MSRSSGAVVLALVTLAAVDPATIPAPAAGQSPAARLASGPPTSSEADTLQLAELQAEAARLDPRSRALALQERASGARLEAIGAGWLPRLELEGQGSYQTEVPSVRLGSTGALPPGLEIPVPPKDRYEAALEVDQLLYDGGRIARQRSIERARLAERRAATRTSLHDLRAELDAAFFTALLEQERREQLALLVAELEARRRLVSGRVDAGALVPAELAAVEAELVGAGQQLDEAETARRSALRRLGALTGREIGEASVLEVPELERAEALADSGGAAPADDSLPPWASRPEWQRQKSLEERLRSEAALADAGDAPRASAFVRGAYGRPGLDFFDDEFSAYATAGVRVTWSLFDGGSSGSEAAALRLEAEAAAAERAALGEALRRRVEAIRSEVGHLRRALESDDRLVELRDERARTALRQLEEGVLLPADYVERRTELFEARLRRSTHRVRLAAARAELLRVLGRPLPPTTGAPRR